MSNFKLRDKFYENDNISTLIQRVRIDHGCSSKHATEIVSLYQTLYFYTFGQDATNPDEFDYKTLSLEVANDYFVESLLTFLSGKSVKTYIEMQVMKH
jgi:hypothetical protein